MGGQYAECLLRLLQGLPGGERLLLEVGKGPDRRFRVGAQADGKLEFFRHRAGCVLWFGYVGIVSSAASIAVVHVLLRVRDGDRAFLDHLESHRLDFPFGLLTISTQRRHPFSSASASRMASR